MAIAAINDWLNSNGTLLEGVALLKAHGSPSGTDLFLYSCPDNSILRNRLREQLEGLMAPMLQKVKEATQALKAPIAAHPERSLDRQSEDLALTADTKQDLTEQMLPVQLRPLRRKLKELHSALTYLRGSLSRIPDGMELRRTAERVVNIHAEMKAGWLILETWRATGTILDPEERPKPVVGEGDRIKRRNALRSYLSKAKKGTRKYSDEQLASFRGELAQIEQQLDESA